MKNRKGFTLIETIIAIVIASIISLFVGAYIVQAFKSWQFIGGQKSMTFSDRSALYMMTREIKGMNKNTSISTFETTRLSFRDMSNNSITYRQSVTDLYRDYNASPNILLKNLKNPGGLSFSCLKVDGTSAATNEDISIVRIRLTTLNGSNKFVIESSAKLRIN